MRVVNVVLATIFLFLLSSTLVSANLLDVLVVGDLVDGSIINSYSSDSFLLEVSGSEIVFETLPVNPSDVMFMNFWIDDSNKNFEISVFDFEVSEWVVLSNGISSGQKILVQNAFVTSGCLSPTDSFRIRLVSSNGNGRIDIDKFIITSSPVTESVMRVEQVDRVGVVESIDEPKLHVFGTEYFPLDNGSVFLQLKDGVGSLVDNASCRLSVYYPDKSLWLDSVSMDFLEDGLYYYDLFIPEILGIYMTSVYCEYSTLEVVFDKPDGDILLSGSGVFEHGSTGDPVEVLDSDCTMAEAKDTYFQEFQYNNSEVGNLDFSDINAIDLSWIGQNDKNGCYLEAYNFVTSSWVSVGDSFDKSQDDNGDCHKSHGVSRTLSSDSVNLSNFVSGDLFNWRVYCSADDKKILTDDVFLSFHKSGFFVDDIRGSSEIHVNSLNHFANLNLSFNSQFESLHNLTLLVNNSIISEVQFNHNVTQDLIISNSLFLSNLFSSGFDNLSSLVIGVNNSLSSEILSQSSIVQTLISSVNSSVVSEVVSQADFTNSLVNDSFNSLSAQISGIGVNTTILEESVNNLSVDFGVHNNLLLFVNQSIIDSINGLPDYNDNFSSVLSAIVGLPDYNGNLSDILDAVNSIVATDYSQNFSDVLIAIDNIPFVNYSSNFSDVLLAISELPDYSGNFSDLFAEISNIPFVDYSQNFSDVLYLLNSLDLDIAGLESLVIGMNSSINTNINGLSSQISGIDSDISNLDSDLQTHDSDIKDRLDDLELDLSLCDDHLDVLESKIDLILAKLNVVTSDINLVADTHDCLEGSVWSVDVVATDNFGNYLNNDTLSCNITTNMWGVNPLDWDGDSFIYSHICGYGNDTISWVVDCDTN